MICNKLDIRCSLVAFIYSKYCCNNIGFSFSIRNNMIVFNDVVSIVAFFLRVLQFPSSLFEQ